MKSWMQDLAAIALLLILAGLVYGFLWRPGHVLHSRHSDIPAIHVAMKTVAFRNLEAGRGLPFWKSDQLSGGPAFTHPQMLATHPLHALFLLWPPLSAMGGTVWLHFLVAGLSFYVLGSVMGLEFWGRLVAAIAGMLNFKLIILVYAGWMSLISSFVVMPLLIAVLLRLIERPGLGPALGMAAIGALSLHSGQVQIFYYTTLILAGYAAVMVVVWLRQGQTRHLGQFAGWTSAGVILAVALTAYLLLPLAAEAPLTSRLEADYQFFLNNHSLRGLHLLTFLHPELLGSPIENTYGPVELWEDVGYFGLIPLLLAIGGAVAGWRRKHTPFFAVAMLVSILLAFDSPILQSLFHYLPGYGLFRSPSRFLFVTSILGIALAGVGADEMVRFLRKQGGHPAWSATAVLALVFLMGCEGVHYAHRYLVTAPHKEALPTTDYQRFFAEDPAVFRIAPVVRWTINYGWAAPMNLQLVTGYDPHNLRHYQQYLALLQFGEIPSADQSPGARVWTDLLGLRRLDLIDALNVKYVAAPTPLNPLPAGYELVAQFANQPFFKFYEGTEHGPIFIYRNQSARDRVFWSDDVLPVENDMQAIEQIKTHNLRQTAVVRGAEPNAGAGQGSERDSARVVEAYDGQLVVETSSQDRRFLVISEIWHPGWRASLDGQPIDLYQTNLALLGAWVPAGLHRLELTFRPLWWPAAMTITLAAAVIFAVLVIVWRVRTKHVDPVGPRDS